MHKWTILAAALVTACNRGTTEAVEGTGTLEVVEVRVAPAVPARVARILVVEGQVVKLATERKHLTNLIKMVAYQAESELVRLAAPHLERSEDEGRTLVQNALTLAGDLEVTATDLRVHLEPLSSPRRTRALAALCEAINATSTRRLNHMNVPSPPQGGRLITPSRFALRCW